MRIRKSIYYTAMLTLFVTGPVLAAESISQIQSLQGQAWVQRGDKNIELNGASDIYSGDLVSTSHTGRLGTQLWSQVSLKLGANSKIIIISEANKTKENASAAQKIIKLEYGASCVEINDLMDSPVLFQIGGRVTIKFIKPVELCLSSDEDKSEIQLIKGRAELVHLTNSMVIALNEPGSEISFFNGGIFKLVSASSAAAQVIPMGDLKAFSKIDFLNKSSSTVELKVPSKTEVPVALPKTESLNKMSKTEEPKEPSKAAGLKVSSKTEAPIALSKTEDSKESSKVKNQKTPSKITVPIALSETEGLKESSKTVDQKTPPKIAAPIALSNTGDSNQPSNTKNTEGLYNVYLHTRRSYEPTAAVNRRLRESGYSSFIIDEIDNQGPIFRVSVPDFESITAAREFVDKVVVGLGIHDAWIERHLKKLSKTEKQRKASFKKAEPKPIARMEAQKNIAKTETPIALSKTQDLKGGSKTQAPIALSKTNDSNKSSKTSNGQELYNVNLNSSRSYEATAAINRRLRESGYSSFVVDEIDNQGPLFRVSVPNFETITAARGFIDKVVVSLGIHDAWIERQLQKK
jgi:cell division septation protein DedD